MKRAVAVLLASFVFTSACDESISKGWLVDRTRVLGARVEVAGEPGRASVAPGEPALLRWLVVSPGPAPRLGWTFASCAPPPGNFADPRCEGPVLSRDSGTSDGTAFVDMPLVAPHTLPEILVLAAFCTNGDPSLDPSSFTATCASGDALLASTLIRVHVGGASPNTNPPLADDVITLDGVVLPPTTAGAPGSACAGAPDAPPVLAGSPERTLAFRFRDEQREVDPEGKREALLVTHVVSSGELDRQYSALEADEPAPKEVTVKWKPPVEAPSRDGGLVEVFFVLRDGRGGTTYARRAVCVR